MLHRSLIVAGLATLVMAAPVQAQQPVSDDPQLDQILNDAIVNPSGGQSLSVPPGYSDLMPQGGYGAVPGSDPVLSLPPSGDPLLSSPAQPVISPGDIEALTRPAAPVEVPAAPPVAVPVDPKTQFFRQRERLLEPTDHDPLPPDTVAYCDRDWPGEPTMQDWCRRVNKAALRRVARLYMMYGEGKPDAEPVFDTCRHRFWPDFRLIDTCISDTLGIE